MKQFPIPRRVETFRRSKLDWAVLAESRTRKMPTLVSDTVTYPEAIVRETLRFKSAQALNEQIIRSVLAISDWKFSRCCRLGRPDGCE